MLTQSIGDNRFALGGHRADSAGGMSEKKETTTAANGLVSIQVDRSANDALSAWCGEMRVKREVLSQVIRWWMAQPQAFKLVTLGEADPDFVEMYAATLEKLASRMREQPAELPAAPAADPAHSLPPDVWVEIARVSKMMGWPDVTTYLRQHAATYPPQPMYRDYGPEPDAAGRGSAPSRPRKHAKGRGGPRRQTALPPPG